MADARGQAAAQAAPDPIPRLIRSRATAEPGRPAVSCGGRTLTRAELETRSNRLARAYASLGVGVGDTVAIVLPNGVEFAEATLATWKLGGIPLPLSSGMPVPELTKILGLAAPKLIVGSESDSFAGWTCLVAGFEPDSGTDASPIVPDRVSPSVRIITTGGSTGRPKLLRSNETSELDALRRGEFFEMAEEGTILIPGPLYHGSGFVWLTLGLCLGKHVVILPRFDAREALTAMATESVDWTFLVPTMMSRMLRALHAEPRRFDLRSLRQVWHGAAVCPSWLKREWIELLGPDRITELYGASESPIGLTISGRQWLEHPGSVGRPAVGEIKICGQHGETLPPDEVGEIFMRAPAGTPPHVTIVGAEPRDVDGWRSVGDLGSVDKDGYLYISDRRVDLIVSGGANVYPAEVESVLLQHPSVARVVVVGIPDDDLGQRVHALVEPDSEVMVDELLEFVGQRLVRYKVPRSIRLVNEPLRDDSDKARRSAIRDREIEFLGRDPDLSINTVRR